MNPSLWLSKNEEIEYPRLNEDIECDVAIIGGGLTAIALAYRLQSTNQKIVILEKNRIMHGSSGRNTGKLTAQHDCVYHSITKSETAKQYFDYNTQAIEWVKQTLTQEKIDCCFKSLTTGVFANDEKKIAILKKEADFYQKHQIPFIYTETAKTPFPCNALLKMKNQAQFNPAAFGLGLARQLKENVSIYENTKIVELQTSTNLQCTSATQFKIIAKQIIIATLTPLFNLKHFFFSRLDPIRSYIVAAKYNESFEEALISIDYPSISLRKVIIENTPYLLFCGGDHSPYQKTVDPYLFLKNFAFEHFKIKSFDYQWSTQDNMTFDKLPFIGPINKEKNILVACGYNTWGNSQGIAASQILHQILVDPNFEVPTFCNPNRKSDLLSLNFLQGNFGIASRYIQGKLQQIEKISDLKNGDIIKMGVHQYGYYKDIKGREYLLHMKCPHLGCQLLFNAIDDTWDCPCHGSRFNYDGKIITSPSHQDLQQYPGLNSLNPHL